MAAVPKTAGCAFVTVRLGATQTFKILADRNVNTLETDTLYHCGSSEGTPVTVLELVLAKIGVAMTQGDARIELLIDDNNRIVG